MLSLSVTNAVDAAPDITGDAVDTIKLVENSDDDIDSDTLASDILTILSEIEDNSANSTTTDELYYEMGRTIADYSAIVIPNLIIADMDVYWAKATEFARESTLALVKTVALCVSALMVGILPGKGVGNTWPPYRSQVFGPEISTYFTDPYTFLHFEDGIIAYLLWGWWGTDNSSLALPEPFKMFWNEFGGLTLGLFAGYVFEIFENSDFIINRFVRDHGTSQFYKGDSKINVFGDILALGMGYSMSKVCTAFGLWWFPILWLVTSEILCALTFRDNLVLGAIQTISPQDWIKSFQQEIVPDHLKGIMRAGYWDNKVRDTPEQFIDRIQRINPDLMISKFSRLNHNDLLVSRSFFEEVNTSIRRL